jgi:hypothetical protein
MSATDASTCIEKQPMTSSLADLYLDLLKDVLTDTTFQAGPCTENESSAAYLQSFIEHCIKGRALTMVPRVRLDNIQMCIERVLRENVPGDLIEAGVWRGGAAIFMKAVLKAYDSERRRVWVADSFEGLPRPNADLHPVEARAYESKVMRDVYHYFAVGVDEVKNNFERFGLLDDGVKFLKGWFKDTLASAPIERLAVVRLDGDYYESTMDCLINLYDKLSPGGYLVVDDYGQDDWTYCKQAVDEFRNKRRIVEPIVRVDSTCHFWRKAA